MSQRIRTKRGLETLMNALASATAGLPIECADFKTICFHLASESSAQLTVQFAASFSLTQPNFNTPSSKTNPWFYVSVSDLSVNNNISGAVGVVYTGTDSVSGYEVNTNFIKWFCPIITSFTAGKLTCVVDAVNELS